MYSMHTNLSGFIFRQGMWSWMNKEVKTLLNTNSWVLLKYISLSLTHSIIISRTDTNMNTYTSDPSLSFLFPYKIFHIFN